MSRVVSFERQFRIDFEHANKLAKKSLEYELWYFKYEYFFKDFRNSADKHNIEKTITLRHQHARGRKSGVIRMAIPHGFKKYQKMAKVT